MPNPLLNLLIKLGIDPADYEAGLDQAERKASGIPITGNLAVIGAGVASLGGFLGSTIKPASDIYETQEKVNIVFGKEEQ